MERRRWPDDATELLTRHIDKMPHARLAEFISARFPLFKVTEKQVYRKIAHIKRAQAAKARAPVEGEPVRKTRRTWPDEIVEYLHENVGLRTYARIADLITATYPAFPVTEMQVRKKVNALGIASAENTENITLADAARQLGVTLAGVQYAIRKLNVPVRRTKQSKYTFLSPTAFEKLQAYFAPPPEPSVPTSEAADLIHKSKKVVQALVQKGKLKAYWYKGENHISVASIHAFLDEVWLASKPGKWTHFKKATSMTGWSKGRMRRALEQGRIEGWKHSGEWYIALDAVNRIVEAKRPPGVPHVTTDEAGRRHGSNGEYIAKRLRAGKLKGWKVGDIWYVDEADLTAYIERYGGRKRAAVQPRDVQRDGQVLQRVPIQSYEAGGRGAESADYRGLPA